MPKGLGRKRGSTAYNPIDVHVGARLPRKPPKSEDPLHKRETLEFVRAYYRIKDPEIRGHVRKLIQTTASASSRSS